MSRYVVRRLLQIPFAVLGITLIIFVLIRFRGDPTALYLPPDAPPELRVQMRHNLGLDLPLASWLDLHLGFQYGSERRNNVRRHLEFFQPFRIPAYTLVRAGLSTGPVLFDHLVLFVYLTNLFDHDMRDPAARPDRLPGLVPRGPFAFMAGIGWRP